MDNRHLDREALEKFLSDELAEEESRALQRHVFTCSECEERLVRLLPGTRTRRGGRPTNGESHRELIRRVADEKKAESVASRSALELERREAPALFEELEARGPEERRHRVWNDSRYQTWGLFEWLADRSHEILPQEPRKSEDLVRLALDVAGRLDASRYGAPAIEAAQARASTHLGNTLRVLSDFRQAEQAFQTAELHFGRSWLDPLDEGLLLESRAALRRAQGRFDEALRLLDTAIAIYREINEPHLQGRALMIKGLTLQYSNDSRAAADCFRESLFLLDGAREPRLIVMSQCNLILSLHESGRSAEAAALVENARRLVAEMGKRSDRLRLDWIAGRVAAATGRETEAERSFLEIRDAFVEDDLAYDAALISLDLSALYARQGRTADVKLLAAEILPIFRSREVHREALAALITFEQAAEQEQLTLGLVQEISSYLEKVRANPGLRFRGETAS
ncbi:MAG TPA: tetratricopeptide repeat protein [Thermoanaerobaculia bacterium]|nr:tetratricopeptide repeat protein [Thermoanaerobaculia bacterium]